MSEKSFAAESENVRPWTQARLAVPLIFLATLCFQLPFFDRWYSFLDEGHVLMFADIVVKGGELYRDATIYPLPGAFYLLAYAFKALGASVILSRWIVVLEFCIFVPLVFLWLRRLIPPRWAYGAVVVLWFYRLWSFPHWQFYSYTTTALLFLLCALMCIVRFIETERDSFLIGAGLFLGIGAACKQDYAAALFLAASFTLTVHARSRRSVAEPLLVRRVLALFVVPGAAVGGLLALYFSVLGILPDLVEQTVLGHIKGLASFAYPEMPNLFPLFSQDPQLRDTLGFFSYFPGIVFSEDVGHVRSSYLYRETALLDFLLKLFYYAPYFLTAAGTVRAWRRRGMLRDAFARERYLVELMLLTFALGITLVLTVNRPQDYVHFAVVYWPFLCLALIYLQDFLRPRKMLAWGVAASMFLPVGYAGAYSYRLVKNLRQINSELISGERAGIYATRTDGLLLAEIVDYVQANTRPDERVAVIPYFPIVQFLMDRLGPHRSSYIVWPYPDFEDRDARIIRAMDAWDVEIVIYNFTQFINFPLMSEYSPELFEYVVDHYQMERVFSYDYSGYKLAALRREREELPGHPILNSVARVGDLFIDHEMGPDEPLPPGARESYLARELWPFRPVMAIKPSRQGERSVFTLELSVPQGAHLVGAVGANPKNWFVHPSYDTTYTVDVVAKNGARERLHTRTLKPHTRFDDRGWFDFDVSLTRYAGRDVVLEFSTSALLPRAGSIFAGGFGLPRLVIREVAADAHTKAMELN